MRVPSGFVAAEKQLKQSLKSRDLSRIEGTVSQLSPFSEEAVVYLLHHIKMQDVRLKPGYATPYTEQIDAKTLQGSGPWASSTNIDECYVAIGILSFLKQAESHLAVQKFVSGVKALHFVGHAAVDIQHLSVFSALEILSITAYKNWRDTYSLSGINGIPLSLKKMFLIRASISNLSTWKAESYKKLADVYWWNAHIDSIGIFSRLPCLEALSLLGDRIEGFVDENVCSFGKSVKTLRLDRIPLSKLNFLAMPNLQSFSFRGEFTGQFHCEAHDIQELRLDFSDDPVAVNLQNLPKLKTLNYFGRRWGTETTVCTAFHLRTCALLESVVINGHVSNISIVGCQSLTSVSLESHCTKLHPQVQLATLPILNSLKVMSGGDSWQEKRKSYCLKLDAAPQLQELYLNNIDWNAPLSSVPNLPQLTSFVLKERLASAVELPHMPSLQHLALHVQGVAELKDVRQLSGGSTATNGLRFASLDSLKLSLEIQSLAGLETPKLKTITFTQTPNLQNVDALLNSSQLHCIEAVDALQISPRMPKKRLEGEAATKYLAKLSRSVARAKKRTKSTTKKKARSTKSWITFIRKMIKQQSHDSFAVLQSEITNMPDDFWSQIFAGMEAKNISGANWYENRYFPYPRGKQLLNKSWDPIKTVMRGSTYHFALYVYYFLLTHAPKEQPFVTQSFAKLTSLLVTIEDGLSMYSITAFSPLNFLSLGRPRLHYSTMPNTSLELDTLGTAITVKELELHGLNFRAEKLTLPTLGKVSIERCNGPNLCFLQNVSTLQKLYVTQSHIEDYSHVPFGSLVNLQIQSSQVGQVFPGKVLKDCHSLETLSLENISISDFSFLRECINLKRLILVNVTAAEAPSLGALKNLEKVELCNVSPNLLSMFETASEVRELVLKELKNDSLKPLVGAQKLENLTIEKCSLLNGQGLPTLSALKKLELSHQEALVLQHNQPALVELRASYLQELTGVQHLGGLQQLQLKYNAVPIDMLYGLFSLRNVRISNHVACDINLATVTSWPMLEKLYIRGVLEVSDLSPLVALNQLQTLAMNPKVVGNLDVLAQIPNLTEVHFTGRMLRTVKKLLPSAKISTYY